jgi:hypothetical protein
VKYFLLNARFAIGVEENRIPSLGHDLEVADAAIGRRLLSRSLIKSVS